jgi:hypothetical protein
MDTEFTELPACETCKIIDFSETEIRPGTVNDTYILYVSGTKPHENIEVRLIPRVHFTRPQYWGIEVVGCLSRISLPTKGPYEVMIPLEGIRGMKGIEVIGASSSEQIKL